MGKLSRNRVFTIKTKANPSLFSVKRRKLSPPAFNIIKKDVKGDRLQLETSDKITMPSLEVKIKIKNVKRIEDGDRTWVI